MQLLEWLKLARRTIQNVGENVNELKFSYTAGGKEKW